MMRNGWRHRWRGSAALVLSLTFLGAVAAQPPAKETPPADSKDAARQEPPSIWSRVPPVRIFPRPGAFTIAPTGPGYYSLRDWLEHHWRDKPPTYGYLPLALYQPSFFDADFRYLDKIDPADRDLFDALKRMHPGECWMLSFGGAHWLRYVKEEHNRLSGRDNTYQLFRSRAYADLWYADEFRLYAEFIDARSYNEDLPPLPIDVNRTDMLNLFVDLKLTDYRDKPVYVRLGRQEMLLGSQRLVSPLEWANTRRSFQGLRAFRQGEKFDVDLFWVQPVLVSPSHLDSVDDDVNFAGLWTTYRPRPGQFLDVYYLNLDQARPVAVGRADVLGGFNASTLGARFAGDYKQFLWDVEGAYQFGRWSNQDLSAGMFTIGGGYQFAKLPMNPQFWLYHDWASGDHSRGLGNTNRTFNQVFPFGHYYLGFIDQVGRRNIRDTNMQLAFYPAKWIATTLQYHIFHLDSTTDALYNAAGVATRRDPTGRAGNDVGQELDLLVNVHVGTHQDVLIGYSKLFAGDFLKATGSPRSPELFYLQYVFRW